MIRKQQSFQFCYPVPTCPWHHSGWTGMGLNTASNIPEQFAPCHPQALLLDPTPVLITLFAQGLVTHTWHPLGPKNHVCTCLNHNVDKVKLLCFWVTCKSEERAWLEKVVLSPWADTSEPPQCSCWESTSFFVFVLFCFLVNSELLEPWDWISCLTKSSLSSTGLAPTYVLFESISLYVHQLQLIYGTIKYNFSTHSPHPHPRIREKQIRALLLLVKLMQNSLWPIQVRKEWTLLT